MNFIQNKIFQKIKVLETFENKQQLIPYYQSFIEFNLIYTLSYLWNRYILQISAEEREFIYNNINSPTIGTIVSIIRKLDFENEISNDKTLISVVNEYPNLRNERIGHGFTFEDSAETLLQTLKGISLKILNCKITINRNEMNFVYVISKEKSIFKGIIYDASGTSVKPWNCHESIRKFGINNLYISSDLNIYYRVSPFIEILDESELYCFASIQEKLLGKIKYNRLIKTGNYFRDWEELVQLDIELDNEKRKSANGTIINIFENNYNKYIDIGIKNKILSFLTKDKSSVCATIWGHGGVGKTATVQSVCEDLTNSQNKKFDYIIFLSAKNRRYNYITGVIEEVTETVSSLEDILKNVNSILFNSPDENQDSIISMDSNLCLVIDDFETFIDEEKNKIREFILRLNINKHKVIITTRANIIIGIEIPTDELNEVETIKFLKEVVNIEIPSMADTISYYINSDETIHKIHEITSGRPLFIFQFAFTIGQVGGIEHALKYKINDSQAAKIFLYGRIYDDYLSDPGKDVFVVISLLVSNEDLTNLIDKIKYVLNFEHEEDKFNLAIKELVKIKIIKIDEENRFFEVYSKEIFMIMTNFFHDRNPSFKSTCISRLNQINKDKSLDNDQALLFNANSSRLSKSEEEVIANYRQILNRPSSPEEIKVQAIINLCTYFIDRGKRKNALELIDEFKHLFPHNGFFSKMQANYYWGIGTLEHKEKAIKILLDYKANGISMKNDIDLEIFGILLTYRCIYLVNEWEDLSSKRKFKEITSNEFRIKRVAQEQICRDIHNHLGCQLFDFLQKKKLSDMTNSVRQSLISAMYQFLEICLRLQKFELGKEIAEYMTYFAPKHYHPQFERKFERFNSLIYSSNK